MWLVSERVSDPRERLQRELRLPGDLLRRVESSPAASSGATVNAIIAMLLMDQFVGGVEP
jgi:hypothetical protein